MHMELDNNGKIIKFEDRWSVFISSRTILQLLENDPLIRDD